MVMKWEGSGGGRLRHGCWWIDTAGTVCHYTLNYVISICLEMCLREGVRNLRRHVMGLRCRIHCRHARFRKTS